MNDYARNLFFISFFNSAFSLATFIFAWWNTREKVIRSRFDGQAKKLADLDGKVGNLPAHCPGHAALASKQEAQGDRLAQHRELLTALETDLKHLPTVRDIEKLYERMNDVRAQVGNLQSEVAKIAGAMPGMTHLTEVMNEYLMNHGGKQ